MEISQFGWNTATVGFVGTMLFSFLGAWGLWKQNSAIWNTRSGRSVSVGYFSFFLAYFASGFLYGLNKDDLALKLHCGGRLLFHIPILIGLWNFKGFTRNEKLLSLIFILGVFLIPDRQQAFLAYSIASIVAYAAQPWEILRNKDPGTVSIKLHAIYLGSAAFWTFYGFAVDDLVLKLTTPPNIVIAALTIMLCLKYKNG